MTIPIMAPVQPPSSPMSGYPAYYYIQAWMERITDYENVIVQSPDQQGVIGALQTFELYLEREYGQAMQHDLDFFVEEITLLDLPIVTRADVDKALEKELTILKKKESHHDIAPTAETTEAH